MAKSIYLACIIAFSLLGAAHSPAAETKTKTDLSRDVYVENSVTNFVLVVKIAPSDNKSVTSFEVSAPDPGDYTLVCFIDGKAFKETKKFKAPGTFKLSTRGMLPGTHKITLQLVDEAGKVGSRTHQIEIP